MEIMLSHLGVGVAYDALDGLDVHAQCLHLRHIGVTAAVRREQADIARFFQRFAEHISEMGGIAGQAGLGAFPDELVGSIPQFDGTRADIRRYGNIPDTVFGFRTADADRTFYDLYDARACHFNMDTGCVELLLRDVLLRDGRKISIDCTGVEDALDVTMAQRPELD